MLCTSLLPIVERFRAEHPQARVEVRRSSARQIPSEVLGRGLDYGVLTFPARERGLRSLPLGDDELAMLIHPRASVRPAQQRDDGGGRPPRR